MKIWSELKRELLRFGRCESGSVIILVCILTAIVLVGIVGFALDITRGEILQGRMSSALDASGLAVERQVQTIPANNQQQWANAQAQRYFNANFPAGYLGSSQIAPTVSPVTADWKTIALNANSSMPTLLMKQKGVKSINVGTSSQVTANNNGALELALIMDNSGAMAKPVSTGGGTRIAALQSAATTLIDALFGQSATLPNTYVSLIPYSDVVRFDPTMANPWLIANQRYNPLSNFAGCMTNRTDSNFATDLSPYADYFPRYNGPFDLSNKVNITGYSIYNTVHKIPDITLHYSTSPIVNGALTNDPTGQMAAMASISQGSKPISNGTRLMITDLTLNLPGGRFPDEIDYVFKDASGKVVNNSEMLKIDFGAAYISSFANLYIGQFYLEGGNPCLFPVNGKCQERGQWQTFDSNNNLLSQGAMGGVDNNTVPNYLTETVNAGSPFQSVQLIAIDEGNRSAIDPHIGLIDNSDFSVLGFDYNPLCTPLLQPSFFLQDKSTIDYQISLTQAAGPTRSDVGLAWGWFMLSPNWQGLFDSNLPNLPLDPKNNITQKIAVVITQGTNVDPSYDANFAKICTNMKNAGITIYTISFDAQSATVKTLLQNCASAPANYFDAPTTAALNTAFQNIGNAIDISYIRISK